MPSWKKVVASGSDASFSSLTVDTYVSASSFKGSFTGSLEGTASQAISSSYALTASYALFAANGGGGGISAIYIANAGITQGTASYFDFTGAGVTATVSNNTASINVTGGGGGGTNSGQTTNFTQSVAATTWTFVHNLNTRTPLVQVYDTSYNQIVPQYISSSNANTILINFGIATAGYAVASTGGTIIVTGSNVILNQTSPATTWSFEHNLNYQYPVFQIYGSTDEVIIPERIVATDLTSSLIYFPSPVSGKAVATIGGFSGSSGAGVGFPFSGSAVITGSFMVSQSFVDFSNASYVTGSFTGSLYGSASFATSASFAFTASSANSFVVRNNLTASNALITGTLTAQTLVVQTVTSSIVYSSGSNRFGSELTDRQTFTGSVDITGSLIVNESSVILTNQTSSMSVLSASFASNGGVTQILAGANVTIAPTNGKGQVTISSTGGAGPFFNTATGSYGSFYDTTTQTNPVANIPRSMSFNTTDITNGVSISGSTSPFNTYIKTENAGVYDIQFSAQIDKTDSGADEIVIWLAKNGTALADTATTLTLTGNNDKQVAAWNWFVNSAANDYYQIIWYSADTNLRILAETAGGGHPGIPSVIATVNRVDQFLSNSGSFSGSFSGALTGSLFGTASWAQNASTASYVVTAQTASYVANAVSSSYAYTASSAISSSYAYTASSAINASASLTSISASYALSASYAYTASSAISSSFATFAYSASFAPGFSVSMSQATPALTWSFTHNLNSRNPVVQVYDTTYAQIIPNQIVGMDNSTAEIRFDYAQAGYAVFSNGGGLYVTGSTSTLVQTVGAATWSFTHNLNNKYNTYEVYDDNDYVLIPSAIKAIDTNSAELYFSGPQTGRAVAQFSGINGAPNATTASYAVSASFATNAASASYLNPITNSYVVLTQVSQSLNYVDDVAAAAGGVPLGGIYRNGNFILIRLS
jgi:hypothetical protein